MSLRAVIVATLLGCGLLAVGGRASFAHVVTDAEARKLTFDALTAAPRPAPMSRAIYRPAMAVRSFRHNVRGERSIHRTRAIMHRRTSHRARRS